MIELFEYQRIQHFQNIHIVVKMLYLQVKQMKLRYLEERDKVIKGQTSRWRFYNKLKTMEKQLAASVSKPKVSLARRFCCTNTSDM